MVQKGIANRAPWEMIQVKKPLILARHKIFKMFQTKGGSEILESLGYTEYTGFALQFPRNIIPDMFAGGPNYTADDELFGKFLTLAFSRNMMTLTFSDHIGNLTVELILASAEVLFYQQTNTLLFF